jgi:hypothetical protein
MNLDLVLAGLGDDDEIQGIPQNSGFVPMDDAFTDSDYGLGEATFTKDKPARPSRTVRECKTQVELAALDRSMLKLIGL